MSYLQAKQTESVWIIEDNSIPLTVDDVRDYFYSTKAAAIEAFWNEFGHINPEVTFRELKRAGSPTPIDGPLVRSVNAQTQQFEGHGEKS